MGAVVIHIASCVTMLPRLALVFHFLNIQNIKSVSVVEMGRGGGVNLVNHEVNNVTVVCTHCSH